MIPLLSYLRGPFEKDSIFRKILSTEENDNADRYRN